MASFFKKIVKPIAKVATAVVDPFTSLVGGYGDEVQKTAAVNIGAGAVGATAVAAGATVAGVAKAAVGLAAAEAANKRAAEAELKRYEAELELEELRAKNRPTIEPLKIDMPYKVETKDNTLWYVFGGLFLILFFLKLRG